MNGKGALVLSALGALLALSLSGIIFLELRRGLPDSDAMTYPITRGQPSPAAIALQTTPETGPDLTTHRSDDILARPLFSPARRPPVAKAAPGAAAVIPRLTGVLISPEGRRVIFADAVGKPVAAGVGDRIGAYAVQSIEVGRIVLTGPDGPRIVTPAFDPRPAAPAGSRPSGGLPGLPGLDGLTGIQGLGVPGLGLPGLGGPAPAGARDSAR